MGELTIERKGQSLLVVTGLWPTTDLPSCGIFVKRRLGNVDAVVVAPRSYRGRVMWRYLDLLWRALTVRGPFTAVEAHVLFPVGCIGLLAAKLRGVPLVVVAHGSDVRLTVRRNRVYRWIGRFVAGSAKVVVANSRDTATYVRALGVDPVVITPGVDLTRFSASPRPRRGRVLYLGGNRIQKGLDVARGLADTLVGPGLREVHPEDVPALIAAHDVVLVPSREEGFGIVAAEAIASGRWVVACDVGGLREVITPGVNGTLVSDGAFAEAIRQTPDYDPVTVAQSARAFGVDLQRVRMAELYA